MVLCAICIKWQHAVCFALLTEKDVPETHICVQCSQNKPVSKLHKDSRGFLKGKDLSLLREGFFPFFPPEDMKIQ